MRCRPPVRRLRLSASSSSKSGGVRSGGAARRTARAGNGLRGWPTPGSPNHTSGIPGHRFASPSPTRGGSRMRESRSYGSVRGALSNERPYRERGETSTRLEVAASEAIQLFSESRRTNSSNQAAEATCLFAARVRRRWEQGRLPTGTRDFEGEPRRQKYRRSATGKQAKVQRNPLQSREKCGQAKSNGKQ